MLTLRCRSAKGASVLKVEGSKLFGEFKNDIEASTGIPAPQQRILGGYPPAEIKDKDSQPVSAVFKSGDSFTVEGAPAAGAAAPTAPPATVPAASASSSASSNDGKGTIVKRAIADDNACLFNAIGYVLEGKTRSKSQQLRQIVVKAIKEDPFTYNEATLGQPTERYTQAILQPNTWGGSVELAVFSSYYKVEIVAFDVINVRPNTFGEGNGYEKRVYLMYDGIHYDALAMSPYPGAPESADTTIFPANDSTIYVKCESCVQRAHDQGQYTDTAKFALLCKDCGAVLLGEKAATEHAMKTKHTNFTEKR